ncbi:unnamed protein product, partial [Linum tenue]
DITQTSCTRIWPKGRQGLEFCSRLFYSFLFEQCRSEVAASADNQDSQVISPRRHLEEEYMDYEAKIVTTFSVV